MASGKDQSGVNPLGRSLCIEGSIAQGSSRALRKDVTSDPVMVASLDWLSYPILDLADAPDALDIMPLDRPDVPPSGAGEGSIRLVAAAICNAIFDATGIRLHRASFTCEWIREDIGVPTRWAC